MTIDSQFMKLAMSLAQRGRGRTANNPSVGALLVQFDKENKLPPVIVGAARTGDGGIPHAEAAVLLMAGDKAKGATLYVTLEPCNHHGRTPPCTEAIIKSAVSRVIYGIKDPNHLVAGAGLEKLKENGIQVIKSALGSEAFKLHGGHCNNYLKNRPEVHLKIALSKDDKYFKGDGRRPQWVTSTGARQRGHLLRLEMDGIIIGAGTLRDDDPDLKCRLPGLEQFSPTPIILHGLHDLPTDRQLIKGAKARKTVIAGHIPGWAKDDYIRNGCDLLPISPTKDGRTDLEQLLAALKEQGMKRVLIEGGPSVIEDFFKERLGDHVHIFRSNEPLEAEGDKFFKDMPLEDYLDKGRFNLVQSNLIAGDQYSVYECNSP